MHLRYHHRQAATIVEFAIVAPVTFILLLGLLIGGLGIFRYQQVARLARDGSRYASVHGSDYAQETGNAAATSTDVYNQVIAPNATALDLTQLTYSVTWNTTNSPSHSTTANGQTVTTTNTVTVTVTYHWIPEAFLGGITMSSSSVAVMSY
jgi:Flp pilus assembly protein TadG